MREFPKELIEQWKRGAWTREKINALENRAEDHIDSCDQCQSNLESPPPDNDTPYFCPVGESLLEDASQASLEYSWQPDFERRPDGLDDIVDPDTYGEDPLGGCIG